MRLDFLMEVFCQYECRRMLSQEEDNRKQLFIPEMANINSGTAEKDLTKMLIHFREKEFSCMAALRKENFEMELQEVFKGLFICLRKETLSVRLWCLLYFPFHESGLWQFKLY